ncbi:hypothetical protein ACHAXR_002644 [Thalassiosira sp. AJA248-18]
MSLHRLHTAAQQRSTQQIEKQQKNSRINQSTTSSCDVKAKEHTRQKRIWDLLRNMPTFTIRFLRLVAFVVFLLPAFVVFAWHYVTCDRVAAYYGNCQMHIDEKNDDEQGHETTTSSETGICNGVANRQKNYTQFKVPFFSRQYLDIYGSRTPSPGKTTKKPVVIFLTGGAWIIGYRMWGTLLGRALAPFGILVIVPDYRNFPRVNIEGMVQDVDLSIQWVFDHVEEYGGDKEKVVLAGQSAGAHIGGVVVAMKVWDWLRRERWAAMESIGMKCTEQEVVDEVQSEPSMEMSPLKSTYLPQQLRGFISTSSPHNLVTMRPILHQHGLSASVQKSIFGGLGEGQNDNSGGREEDVFEKWSPYHLFIKAHEEYVNLLDLGDEKKSEGLEVCDIFPRFCVIHGTADKTVPVKEAIEFISLLSKLQIPTEIKMYKGWSHTDPILEAPMRGNHLYHEDIYELVCTWTGGVGSSSYANGDGNEQSHAIAMKRFDKQHPILQPICPSVLVQVARFCNPF